MMPTIYDPIKIGKMELPNRFVSAPTVRNNADEHGYLTERAIRDYIEGTRGGWGLYQFSASFPHPEGNPFRCMVGIHDSRSVLGHERVTHAFRVAGMKISCQILHVGAICDPNMTGYPAVSATEKGGIFGPCKALSTSEAEERVQMYIDAAARVQEAGYDAVNIHSCQGTLIQQFMSPYTNTRTDKFGEDPGLFPEMIAKGVRERVGPDFPIIWRLAAHEFMEALGEQGYTEEWGKKIAKRLEPWVDCFDITGGRIGFTGMFAFPGPYPERATRVHLATEIKSVVSVPVMGVAKIMDTKIAEDVVASDRCDLAQLCRPAIADPHFARKAIEGRPEDIRKCIACNVCLQSLWDQQWCRCAVNPTYGQEEQMELKPALKSKKVMVIGGGVAGMETALTLAQRGHKVDLYEKGEELGGLVQQVASTHPRLNTRDLRNIVDYHLAQIEKTEGVTVHLETEVTPVVVEKENPDAVVVAVGSEELLPEIPGIDNKKVVTNEDYLRSEGEMEIGDTVVVIGGNYGAETAVSLAREGKKVTMVEESDTHNRPPYSVDLYCRLFQLDMIVNEEKITVLTKTRAVEINDAGVVVEGEDGKKTLEADSVIIAYERKPCEGLYEVLKGKGKELYKIGDCKEPRSIQWAIEEAANVARQI
jgi:2,4-dienoyl-CoA reductase-like NADH-dependent reductase (Old Yellow Enzyme family)/thioredoxin reductase